MAKYSVLSVKVPTDSIIELPETCVVLGLFFTGGSWSVAYLEPMYEGEEATGAKLPTQP